MLPKRCLKIHLLIFLMLFISQRFLYCVLWSLLPNFKCFLFCSFRKQQRTVTWPLKQFFWVSRVLYDYCNVIPEGLDSHFPLYFWQVISLEYGERWELNLCLKISRFVVDPYSNKDPCSNKDLQQIWIPWDINTEMYFNNTN